MNDDVAVPYHMIMSHDQTHQEIIFLDLYIKYTSKKASEENGYYIALAGINPVYEFRYDQDSNQVVFSTTFRYTIMKPCKGEILFGIVTEINRRGIILKSGPIKNIFLSKKRMGDYEFSLCNEPMFLKVKALPYMKRGTKVKFRVLNVEWFQSEEEFNIQATIIGDYLGPI
ncbi:hypothetical protein IEQ34_020032 [Dendrobium chrysotoxum]|uniref:DNA-directed RNA polymerase subunit n=1 Tax=Dendrobium chrysotoxum TaxID=161865 RepID=A0AAV7GBI7_DENCH|nr:hypothetical protein IEQ34_020032 [Dendrobium chrysotoxum]